MQVNATGARLLRARRQHSGRARDQSFAHAARLQKLGVWIYGLAGDVAASLYAIDLRGNVALVLGGEATDCAG